MALPRSLAEAVEMLDRDPDVRPIAGCTDLMVCDPLQRLSAGNLMDLLGIPELDGIRDFGDTIEIGSTTTFASIGGSEVIQARLPALAAAARVVGGWQIQNRATIGGNVINASPAGDSLPVLLALDADALMIGPRGERRVPFARFYRGYRTTALERGEILTAIRVDVPPPGTRQRFRKVGSREAQAISKVVVAMVGRLDDGVVADFRLAAGSVAPTPIRLASVEEALVGRPFDEHLPSLAADLAATAVEPIDDVRSTAAYRRFALGSVVRRMVLDLSGRR